MNTSVYFSNCLNINLKIGSFKLGSGYTATIKKQKSKPGEFLLDGSDIDLYEIWIKSPWKSDWAMFTIFFKDMINHNNLEELKDIIQEKFNLIYFREKSHLRKEKELKKINEIDNSWVDKLIDACSARANIILDAYEEKIKAKEV